MIQCCIVWHGLSATDQSFQSLVIFFFLEPSQTTSLLTAVHELSSHMTVVHDDGDAAADAAAANESMFDMECQNISTHVAGMLPPDVPQSDSSTRSMSSSPVFGRRGIHDVKSTPGLQALHAYVGSDQDDDTQDPLASNTAHIEEIVVPIGFNSHVIKYVYHCFHLVISAC